jgi:Zn-finger nucleic acid-binding protein
MDQCEASGHYGAKLIIFQCPQCSGFWVDGKVVIAVSHDSAVEAEADVSIQDIATEPREIAAYCPRCETYLMEQTGGGLPRGLRIDYCTGCHGYWFDKGELMIYKTYQEEKRKRFKQQEAEKRAKKKDYFPASTPGVVLKFLNTNVSHRGLF